MRKDIGKVALLPRGEWDISTNYEVLDVVTYNNDVYVAWNNSTGQTPSNNSNYWKRMIKGADITLSVDTELNSESTNAVENRVIYAALQDKQGLLTFDSTPTSGSNNPVTSGGVFAAISNAGGGDMLKSLYDSNDNGIVDSAESVPWNGVQDKPNFATVATSGSYADLSDQPAIGTISDLQTTDKSNIVAAINELHEILDDLTTLLSEV